MTPLALEPWTFLVASHALAAFLALFLGGVQVFRRTKGDALHRLVGRIWAVLLLAVAAGSFFFGSWDRPVDWFLRALATWTLISVTWGWTAARRGSVPMHRGMMVGTYVGLLIAFVFVVAVPTRMVPTWLSARPGTMLLVAAGVVVVAVVVVAVARRTTGHGAGVTAPSPPPPVGPLPD